MRIARTCLLVILLALTAGCAVTYPGEIETIGLSDELNQLSADSAPQQTVVNGWTARDYLELAARQNTEVSALLYVSVAVLILIAFTLLAQNRRLLRLEAAVTAGMPASPSAAPRQSATHVDPGQSPG